MNIYNFDNIEIDMYYNQIVYKYFINAECSPLNLIIRVTFTPFIKF